MNLFKLVLGDVARAERFYTAMGLKVVSRNLGGEHKVRAAVVADHEGHTIELVGPML